MDTTKEREWETLYTEVYDDMYERLAVARSVVNNWNEANPNQYVYWEWVEAMEVSNAMYHRLKNEDREEALKTHKMTMELFDKLPIPLCYLLAEKRIMIL